MFDFNLICFHTREFEFPLILRQSACSQFIMSLDCAFYLTTISHALYSLLPSFTGCKDTKDYCAANRYFCNKMPSFRKDCPKTCNVCKYSIDAYEYLIFGGGRKGLRCCSFTSFLLRFCGSFYFNPRYCGFKTLRGLRLLQPLGRGFR